MIALDTNVLIHLLVRTQPEHERAYAWLVANRRPLVTTGTNIAETLRLLTHPKIFRCKLDFPAAVGAVENLVESARITILEEEAEWWRPFREVMAVSKTWKSEDVFDLRIALCLRHNNVREILTLDHGFRRFDFLKMVAF